MVPGAAQMSEFLGSVWAGVLIREGVLAQTQEAEVYFTCWNKQVA